MKKQIITMMLPVVVLWALGFHFELVHIDYVQHTIAFSDGHTMYFPHMYWSFTFGATLVSILLLATGYSIFVGYKHSTRRGRAATKAACYHLILIFVIALYSLLLWQIIVDSLHALIHMIVDGR